MPEPTTFYWHDYETWGRTPRHDGPAQFAGIRTDAELNPIGEPLSIYCRPPLDRLPDPNSCLLTGITPQRAQHDGLPEHAFAAAVLAELGRPATIGVGYNSMRFDDEVTRHLLWRNLFDPYGREWQEGCGRWDLLDVVRVTHALRPEGIEWPRREDGQTSLRLEDLAQANDLYRGLPPGRAHEALTDVLATVALARLIRTRQPRLWAYCLGLRDKNQVRSVLAANRPVLHVSGMYGSQRGGVALVWPFATHPLLRNEVIVWDLAEDPAQLADLTTEEIRTRLFSRADALPDGVTRLPLKTIHVNRAPIVIGALQTLSPAHAERWSVDVERAMRHAETAARITGAMAGVWEAVYAKPASTQEVDVDEDLYGGLVGDADRRALDRLRVALAEGRPPGRAAWSDERLEELTFRYRARNYPATLGGEDRLRWAAHRHARLVHGQGGDLPLAQWMEALEPLHAQAEDREDAAAMEIVEALGQWGDEMVESLDAM